MSNYGVFAGPYCPALGLNNTKHLSVFSPNAGKYGPEKTPYLDSFHAVKSALISDYENIFAYWEECEQSDV